MFSRRIPLVRLLGFEIRFDLTWLILVALVIWTLSVGYFPAAYADLPTSTYIWMGIVGAIGVFASIVLHELAHSVVGRRLGMTIHGITLFAFGGAAELTDEPKTPQAEFLMAIAGPVMSVVLAVLFFLIVQALAAVGETGPIAAVIGYLAIINLVLAGFNMLPAFPLDGGRVLRAALWGWRGDLAWATRIAALIGGGLGLGLIFLGILSAFQGNLINGMWLFLIGLFIRATAAASYQQLLARKLLEGMPVRSLMRPDPIGVAPNLPVAQFVEDYLLGRALKQVPVVEGGRLLGAVGVPDAKAVPPAERTVRQVGEIVRPPEADHVVTPDTDAVAALSQMQRAGLSRLYVVEDGRLVGVLSLRDLLQYLSVRSELDATADTERAGAPATRKSRYA